MSAEDIASSLRGLWQSFSVVCDSAASLAGRSVFREKQEQEQKQEVELELYHSGETLFGEN